MQKLTVVTAASSNHFQALQNLLFSIRTFEPGLQPIVYDLGLTPSERQSVKYPVRDFAFSSYPAHFKLHSDVDYIKERGKAVGHYAWKPTIVHEVAEEFGGKVLWLDSGSLLHQNLDPIRNALDEAPLLTARTHGSVQTWTHPATLQRLSVPFIHLSYKNMDASRVGINTTTAFGSQLTKAWFYAALDPLVIAPKGCTQFNHRWDQAVLTCLVYKLCEQQGVAAPPLFDAKWVSKNNDRLPFNQVKELLCP